MTQEEKSLLLQDLCARLPYEVIVKIKYSKEHGSSYRLRVCSEGDLKLNTDLLELFIQEEIYLKPYLRSMSSMIEEEIIELLKIDGKRGIFSSRHLTWYLDGEVADFLNANHFDYRGLIEKGLALEAPEGMYKTWNSLRGNLKEDNQGNIVGGLKL